MKSIQNIIKLLPAFTGVVLATCTAGTELPGEGKNVAHEVEITILAEDMTPVRATRSIGSGGLDFTLLQPVTRVSDYEENIGNLITSLYILQFTDGRLVAPPQSYSSYGIPSQEIDGKTLYKLKAGLVANPAKNTYIYVVANLYSDKFPSGPNYKNYTQANFLADFLTVEREEDIAYDQAFLMIGSWHGKVNSNVQIHMDLHRILSRLRMSLHIAPQLQLNFTSARIMGVHNKVYFFGSEDVVFPEANEANFLDYSPYYADPGDSDTHIQDGTEMAWYVPENRRGTNPAIEHQQDKYWQYDPGLVGGRSLSTHLVLKGTYTDAGGDTSIATITLYPGGNVTDDFNIVRGSSYDMDVSINTFDAEGDNRIELEKGPFVAYHYYYRNRYGDDYFMVIDYVTGYQTGEPIAPGEDILNKYKHIAQAYLGESGGYTTGDGRVIDGPSSVDANNLNNIVKICYDAVYNGN